MKPATIICLFALFCLCASARAGDAGEKPAEKPPQNSEEKKKEKTVETVTLGSGCFWCAEAVLQRIKGIESVKSGYSGGAVKN
ncbi:peptide-methionine (S)-S-oxide reductase, partial [Candidatus Sumerlaeota bacterium]|nr:peptide-methionine (S)-S-oxide reductase [Candidatus Sumerlaeota bacterium]